MLHAPITQGHRLLFALRPPIELARQIVEASACLRCELLAPDRLHISLLILDDVPTLSPALLAALRAIGGAVSATPVAITLDRLVAAGNWAALRPASVNARLRDMYDQIERLARDHGIAERLDRQFNPHMTLSYHAGVARNERVRSVNWTASELFLIQSHLGHTRHEVCGRWPLTGTDPQLALF